MGASEREPAKSPSLLKQHMLLLGYEGGPLDDATRREKERLGAMRLEALEFLPAPDAAARPSSRGWRASLNLWSGSLLFAALAGLVLAIYGGGLLPSGQWSEPGRDATLRVKGESKVWVYWERQGAARQLESGTVLQNGDRIRAEVLASEDLTGYLAVRDGSGRFLGDAEAVRDSALRLKAGEKGTFSGSVKLVGENEGERLVVVLCGAGVTWDPNGPLAKGCSEQDFPLR